MKRKTYRIVFVGDELYSVQEKVPYLFFFSRWKLHDKTFLTLDRARNYMRDHFKSLCDEDKNKTECIIATYHLMG
jgi:hypothetical protein